MEEQPTEGTVNDDYVIVDDDAAAENVAKDPDVVTNEETEEQEEEEDGDEKHKKETSKNKKNDDTEEEKKKKDIVDVDVDATATPKNKEPITVSIDDSDDDDDSNDDDDDKELDEKEDDDAKASAKVVSSSTSKTDNNTDATEEEGSEKDEASKKKDDDSNEGKQKETPPPNQGKTEDEDEEEEEEEEDVKPAAIISSRRKRTLRISSVCPAIKNGELKPYVGMKFQKLFEDDEWYVGEIDKEPILYENEFGEMEPIWHVKYEDGDEEDLSLEDLKKCKIEDDHDNNSNKKAKSETKASKASEEKSAAIKAKKQYEQAKEQLCSLPCFKEDEVIAALKEVGAPYGLQAVTDAIHKIRDSKTNFNSNSGLFEPEIGLRIRKRFGGKSWYGTVTKDAEWVEEPSEIEGQEPREVKMWEVTYDDGDKDDMTWQELFQNRADRPIRNSTCRGRVLQSLELFSGVGIVTQEFAKRNWAVCSIDNDAASHATIKQDILKIKPKDLEFIPDFIWASPPCFTYSNMSGGKHRKVAEGRYEITEEARQNNFFFTRMWEIMDYCKSLHRHLIVCIENPVGTMSKMPLMKEMTASFGLYCSTVNYCVLGRDDKKPTMIWTNDFGLHCRLNGFKCSKGLCPYYEGTHPISCRHHGNKFNGAAIPEALAEEVAQYVDSKFYMDRIPYTKSAPPPSWERTGQTSCWRDFKPLSSSFATENAAADGAETSTTAASTASAVDSASATATDDDACNDDAVDSSINEVVVVE